MKNNTDKNLNCNLTEDQLKALKHEIREQLANDRHGLLIKFPFIGNLAMRFDLIPVRDMRCRTACTDGKSVYFDCDFFTQLTPQERIFVLAHEIFHNVMLHLVRCQTRIPELFNIATDMEVNYLLEQQGGGNLFKAPKDLCFPPNSMKGKSAEVIYEWLLRKAKKNQKQNANGNGSNTNRKGSSNATGKEYGDGSGGSENDDDHTGNDGNGKHGNKTGKLEGQFDNHQYDADDNSNDDNNTSNSKGGKNGYGITDRWGEVGFDKDFKPSISKDYSEKMREAVIAEAQRTARTQGTMPVGLDGILSQILKPEISWKEELQKFVTACYGGKPRWTPPNRRHIYNETYLQSHRSERLNITVAVDTSGSCIGDLPKFFGELKGLLDSFGKYDLHLINCDAEVSYYEHFDDSNPLVIEKASDVKWSGGGGTSFKPVFKYVREHNIQSDCLVFFTDGFGDAPQNPPPYPTLWILTKDGSKDFCEWGKKIYFKSSTEESYTTLSS